MPYIVQLPFSSPDALNPLCMYIIANPNDEQFIILRDLQSWGWVITHRVNGEEEYVETLRAIQKAVRTYDRQTRMVYSNLIGRPRPSLKQLWEAERVKREDKKLLEGEKVQEKHVEEAQTGREVSIRTSEKEADNEENVIQGDTWYEHQAGRFKQARHEIERLYQACVPHPGKALDIPGLDDSDEDFAHAVVESTGKLFRNKYTHVKTTAVRKCQESHDTGSESSIERELTNIRPPKTNEQIHIKSSSTQDPDVMLIQGLLAGLRQVGSELRHSSRNRQNEVKKEALNPVALQELYTTRIQELTGLNPCAPLPPPTFFIPNIDRGDPYGWQVWDQQMLEREGRLEKERRMEEARQLEEERRLIEERENALHDPYGWEMWDEQRQLVEESQATEERERPPVLRCCVRLGRRRRRRSLQDSARRHRRQGDVGDVMREEREEEGNEERKGGWMKRWLGSKALLNLQPTAYVAL